MRALMSRRDQPLLKARVLKQKAHIAVILADVWRLFSERRGQLLLAFVVIIINRLCGLIFPASSRYLIDNVAGKHQVQLLFPIVLVVMAAYVVQGLSSFGANELLTKSAQKMITKVRIQVQTRLMQLPVKFYDRNKTGAIVSRVMSDVEGIRSLVGAGLIEFTGSILRSEEQT